MSSSRHFMRGIVLAITNCWKCENHVHKTLLWTILLSVFSISKTFRKRAQRCGFLSHQVRVAHCDSGIAIYSERDWQININLFVSNVNTEDCNCRLVGEVVALLEGHFPHCAIHFESDNFPMKEFSRPRRFIYDPKADLELIE